MPLLEGGGDNDGADELRIVDDVHFVDDGVQPTRTRRRCRECEPRARRMACREVRRRRQEALVPGHAAEGSRADVAPKRSAPIARLRSRRQWVRRRCPGGIGCRTKKRSRAATLHGEVGADCRSGLGDDSRTPPPPNSAPKTFGRKIVPFRAAERWPEAESSLFSSCRHRRRMVVRRRCSPSPQGGVGLGRRANSEPFGAAGPTHARPSFIAENGDGVADEQGVARIVPVDADRRRRVRGVDARAAAPAAGHDRDPRATGAAVDASGSTPRYSSGRMRMPATQFRAAATLLQRQDHRADVLAARHVPERSPRFFEGTGLWREGAKTRRRPFILWPSGSSRRTHRRRLAPPAPRPCASTGMPSTGESNCHTRRAPRRRAVLLRATASQAAAMPGSSPIRGETSCCECSTRLVAAEHECAKNVASVPRCGCLVSAQAMRGAAASHARAPCERARNDDGL